MSSPVKIVHEGELVNSGDNRFPVDASLQVNGSAVSASNPIPVTLDTEPHQFATGAPTNATATTANGLAIAANPAREYLAIVNDGDNNVYLGLGVSASANKGIRLNANGGSWETYPGILYAGSVYVITQTSTCVVAIQENE